MTPEERLGLLPELLALANSVEILSSLTDPEGLVGDSEREALDPKELVEEHFGNRSGQIMHPHCLYIIIFPALELRAKAPIFPPNRQKNL